MQNQLRFSLHAADMTPPNTEWLIQTTEDGSEQYYYNPRTQEMRYSMPPEGAMEEKLKEALGSNSSHESYHTNSPRYMDHENNIEKPPVRPERAPNRMMTDEFGNDFRHSIRPVQHQRPSEEYEDDDRVKSELDTHMPLSLTHD